MKVCCTRSVPNTVLDFSRVFQEGSGLCSPVCLLFDVNQFLSSGMRISCFQSCFITALFVAGIVLFSIVPSRR